MSLTKDPNDEGYGFLDKYDNPSPSMILDSDKELYAQEVQQTTKSTGSGFLSGLGALLQQAGMTAVDVIGAKAKAGITSTNPNVNPDAANAAAAANKQQSAITPNYMPWIIGGAGVLGVVVILAVMSRRS